MSDFKIPEDATTTISVSGWHVQSQVGGFPPLHTENVKHARLYDNVNEPELENHPSVVYNITPPSDAASGWPAAVISCGFSPHGSGFEPGLLIVPETSIVFIGAGTTLLAYDLINFEKLWKDKVDLGFLCWVQHGDVVVMSAEIELAAWSVKGEKIWSKYVEPPRDYSVKDGQVRLDVMGRITEFDIQSGKP